MAKIADATVKVNVLGLCAICKWWDQPGSYKDTRWGWCELLPASNDISENPGALAVPCGRKYTMFRTADVFGCVQWEAKA